MIAAVHWLFDSSPLPRRWTGDTWPAAVGWADSVSDLVTCLACAAVALAALVVLARKGPRSLWRRSPRTLADSIEEHAAPLDGVRASGIAARGAAESTLQAREQLLVSFCAEARAPLEAIVRHADHILHALGRGDDLHRHAVAIGQYGRHQLEVLDDVIVDGLTSGVPLRARPAWVALRPLIGQALDIAARGRAVDGRRVTVDVAEDCEVQLWLDPLRLRRAIVNLLDVAVEADTHASGDGPTSAGTTVTARWRDSDSRRRWLKLSIRAPGLELSDADIARLAVTGASDDPAPPALHALTLRTLAIARQSVEAMGGELLIQRTSGGGAVFDVELPVQAVGPAAHEVAAAAAGGVNGTQGMWPLNVLVADAPSILSERVVDHLQRIGADVTIVHDGAEAKAALQWNRAIERVFHVVLVDLDLPDGGSEQVLAALREQHFAGVVIQTASFARRAAQIHIPEIATPETPFPEPLVKPIAATVLYRALAAHLRALGSAQDEALEQLERLASSESTPRVLDS